MYGSLKRLARLKSNSSGGFPPELLTPPGPAPAPAPANACDGAAPPATPDKSSSRSGGGGGLNSPPATGAPLVCNGGPGSYSVTLTGIDKKAAHPLLICRVVDDCLRSNYSFAPKVSDIVERVEFCCHPAGAGYFAVVVFHSRLMAELFLDIHQSKGIDFPFAAPGKRVAMSRNHKSDEFGQLKLLGELAIVHFSGIPDGLAQSDALRDRFEDILRDNRSDFGGNLVKNVHVHGPGSAMIGFKSKAVVDVLMYKCKRNPHLLASIGDGVLIVSAKSGGLGDEISAPPPTPPGPPAADGPKRETPKAPASKPAPDPAPMDVDRREKQQPAGRRLFGSGSPAPVDADPREKQQPAEKRLFGSSGVPELLVGVEQRSLFFSFCNLEKFNRRKLEELVCRALDNAAGGSSEEARGFRLLVDIDTGCPQLIFNSAAAADSLMGYYVSHTDKLHLEGFPFAITRHRRYSRPGARYRQPRGFSKSMTLMLSGLRGLRIHELLLLGAVSEVVERILVETGTLAQGSLALESLTFPPGIDCAVLSMEEGMGTALLSITNNITLSGRRLSLVALGSDQSTLSIHNLPTIQAKYSPTALRSIIMFILRKHRPELATPGCISELSWPVCSARGYVVFQSEAVSDAFMDAYIAHTEDFCKQELMFTVYRHPSYIRPGTVFNREAIAASAAVRYLMVLGIPESLHPVPLRGALSELLDRALAATGVVKQQSFIKHFFYLKGKTSAMLQVDEAVADELVERPGLVLSGADLRIINNPVQNHQPPLPPPPAHLPSPPALLPIPAAVNPIAVAHPGEFFPPAHPLWDPSAPPPGEPVVPGTGGWIELEEGEMMI